MRALKSRLERLERTPPVSKLARSVKDMTDAELIEIILADRLDECEPGADFDRVWETICEEVLANSQKNLDLDDEEYQMYANSRPDMRPAFEAVWRRLQAKGCCIGRRSKQ